MYAGNECVERFKCVRFFVQFELALGIGELSQLDTDFIGQVVRDHVK